MALYDSHRRDVRAREVYAFARNVVNRKRRSVRGCVVQYGFRYVCGVCCGCVVGDNLVCVCRAVHIQLNGQIAVCASFARRAVGDEIRSLRQSYRVRGKRHCGRRGGDGSCERDNRARSDGLRSAVGIECVLKRARARFALRSLRTCRTGFALDALRSLRTRCTGFALNALRSLRTCCTGFALNALRSLRTCCTGFALNALRSLRTCRTGFALNALRSLRTRCTGFALNALRSLRTCCAGSTRCAGCARRTLNTLRSLRALRSHRSHRTGRTLRTYRTSDIFHRVLRASRSCLTARIEKVEKHKRPPSNFM